MRICLVTIEYPPAIGGLGQAVSRIARNLVRYAGHEVHVLCFDSGWQMYETSNPESARNMVGLEVSNGPIVHYTEIPRPERGNLHRARYQRIQKLASEVGFDALVAFGVSYIGFPVILAARERGIRGIVSLHGADIQLEVFRAPGFGQIEWSLQHASSVVSVNQDGLERAAVICNLDGRGSVIPNHIDPESFAHDDTMQALVNPGSLVLATAASFTPNKGLHILLDAAEMLPNLDISLLVIGAPRPQHEEYFAEQMARSRDGLLIVMTGVVPHRAMLSYLKAADIFVLPSLMEGGPNVLLEAMLARLPIVATDSGGSREVLEDEVSGLIVPPGSAQALAHALSRLAGDLALRRRLAQAAHEHVTTELSPRHEAAAWDAVLQRV